MKRILPILLLGLLLLNLTSSVAQTLQPDYGAPASPVNVCNGNAVFRVKIVGGVNACTQGTLNITLPTGYVYATGSAALAAGTGSVTETSFSGNTAVLNIQSIPAAPGFTEISYEAYATCAALGAGTSVNNQAGYTFNSSCLPATSVTSNSFNTQSASLTVTNITNSSYFGAAGDNYTRTITITNNGWGSVSRVNLTDTSGSGLSIKGISASGGWTFVTNKIIVGADTVTTFTLSGAELTQGQSITLIENVTMVSNCNLQSRFATWFGCDNSPCTTNNVSGTATAGATVNNSYVPSLKVIPDLLALNCRGTNYTQTIRLTNTGSVRLNDLSLNLFSTSSLSPASLQSFDGATVASAQAGYSGFQYKSGVNGTWAALTPVSSGNFNSPAVCLAGTTANNIFKIPVINPGDTVFITYIEKNCPVTSPVNNTLFTAGTLLRYDYEAPCGGRTSPVSTLLRNPVSTQLTPQASLPASMLPAQPYTFNYHFPAAQSGLYINTGADASAIRFELKLPANISFSGNASDLSLKHQVTGAVLAGASAFNYNAGSNTIDVTYTVTPGFSINSLHNAVLSFNNLTLNCAASSNGNTVTLNSYLKSSATCSAEEWLFSHQTPVSFACPQPACDVNGGMEFSGFSIQRTNFGLADNDNNGVADVSGTPDLSKVRLDLAMPGDTIMATFNGRFVGGSASPSFQYAYAVDTFSAAAGQLTSLYARVELYLFGSTTPFYVCNNLPVQGGGGATRKVDVSISTLNSIMPLPPGYAEYLDGDSMAVYVYYKVTGNPGPVFLPVQVKNSFYLSDVPDPSSPAQQYTCGNNMQGSFSLVGYGNGTTGTNTYTLVGNGNVATSMDHFLSLGGTAAGSKPFVNEYRPISIHDEFRYTVPANYQYVSAAVTYTYTTGAGTTASKTAAITPVNAAASPLVFNVAALFQNGTFPAGDQGHSLTATVTIKPECEAVPRSEALFNMNQAATPGFNTGFVASQISDNDSIYLTAPEIIASTANTTPTSNDANVSWEIQISNPTIATASRVWMGKASGAGVTITSVQRLSGPGGFVMSTITPTGGGIYQLGTLGQSSNYYRINATYTSCIKDSMKLAYWYDCANTGYPANPASAVFKKELSLAVIPLQPALQNSIVAEPAATAHDFCDVLNYEIETINTGSSNIKDLTVTAYLPSSGGVVYVPGTFQFQYPAGIGTYISIPDAQVTVGSNNVVFTIPNTELAQLISTEGFRVKFGLQTSCGFGSGESFRFTSTGSSFCGNITTATQQQAQKIAINGIPQYTNLYSLSSVTTTGLLDCTTGDIVATYKFKIINNGPLPSTSADGFRMGLPSPWQMDAGSITFTHDPAGASYTGFSGGNYTFLMGAGVAAGDSVVFTATVRVPASAAATLPTGSSAPLSEQAVIRYGGVCSQTGVACPVTEVVVATQNTTTFNYAGGKTGLPVLVITNPAPVCSPATVDITQAGITAGSTAGLTYTYFTNAAGTTVLSNPSAISASGTYYIKGTSAGGCTDIKPVVVVINPLPIAGIVYSGGPFCATGTAGVTQTGQTGGTYSSTSGLALNPTTGAVNLAGSTPGTYTVIYSFSNGTCAATASTTITVSPAPVLVITNPAPVCAPATVDLTQAAITAGSGSGITLSYFTNAAGTTVLTNPSAVSTGGTYYIMATSAAGCKTIQPVTVVINALPVASISYAGPYCILGSATVTQTGQAGGTYSSTSGLSLNPATGAVNLAASTPGTYTVTYTFTNGTCSNTATATIVISGTPNLVINNPAPVCAPATADITAASVTAGSDAGLSFAYFTNAAATNILSNPSSISTSGTYYIQATSPGGCKTVQPVTVTINPLPVAAINYPNSPYCAAGAVTATVTQTGQTGGTYSAPAGLSINPSTGAVNLAASTPGSYTVTYSFTNGVCNSTATATIVIGATPVLTITNPATVCAPATADLTASAITAGSTAGLAYSYFTDAAGTNPLANPSAIAGSGTYYIQGTTAGGCKTPVRPVTVVINPAPVASITYNGAPFCGNATIPVSQTGQGGGTYSSTAGLSINPTTGAVNLGSSAPGTYTITYNFSNGTCSNSATTTITIITSPALITHDPAPVCAPASVDLTASAITSGSTPGLTFNYYSNAAGTTVLANPNAITASGTYYIQGTSASGCITTIVPVTVSIVPAPVASISYPGSPYCQAATSSASVTQAGQGGGTYSSSAGLTINPATGAVNIATSTPGTYTVTYSFSNGTCNNTTTTLLTIESNPVLVINNPAAVCAPATVDLTAASITAGSTPGLSFAYFTNAAGTATLANPSAVTGSGTYYIQGIAASGCKTPVQAVTVSIIPAPVASIAYAGSPYCADGTANVIQIGQGGGTYSAAAGLSINPTTGEVNLAASTSGTYTVTYTFSNGSCTNTATASLTIAPTPVMTITTPATVCSPATVDLTAPALTTGSTPGMSLAYFSDAAATQPLANPNAVAVTGTYYIQGTTPGGCKVLGAVQVTINPRPVAAISYAGTPFCTAGTATVTQTGQAGGTYSSAAGLSINPTTGAINITASTAGTYTVTYTFSNGICGGTATTTVVVASVPVLTVHNPAPVCAPVAVDLTASAVTAGSTAGLSFNYFTDAAGTTTLANPDAVTVSGTYYIQGTTPAGCQSPLRPVTVVVNPIPVASIVYAGSPYCAAQTAAATVTHSGQGGGTYSSTPGLSINPSTGAVNIVGSTPGTYTVTYTFTNGTCNNSTTATIRIDPLPVIVVTNPAAACAPGTVDITASTVTVGSTPGLTYNYYVDPAGLVNLSKPEAINTTGTYYIQGVSPSGCVTGIEAVNVVINLLPVATISYNSSPFCANAGGTGIVTQTGLGGGSYTSSPAGLSINAGTGAINIAASTPGVYTVTYSFNNGLCSNTTKTTVSIMPVPVLLVSNPAPACAPGTVNITAAAVTAGSTPGLTFQYYADAAGTMPLSNASAITTSGTYYIRGVYAATGCVTEIKPVDVVINSSPTLTVAGASLVCKGEAVTITASSPGNNITWQNMNGGNSVIVYPQTTTTYTAVATNAAGCTATATVQVQVRNFEVSLTANTNPIMPGTTLTLTSGATSSYTVVGWKPETMFQSQSAYAQSFIIRDSSQTFAVIGRSADGCLDTASLRVELEPGDKDFFIPNAFTPNNDGKNDVFKLYGSSIQSVELRVFNQWGELVYETKDKTKGWDGTFKGRAQPVGVYPFGVKVTFLDGTVLTKRGTVNLVR